ncbi:MAG: ribonuclease III [Gammaproteobacteria bacterium]|nr:ribonuclease III [Gammaproteobacteria bacterium]
MLAYSGAALAYIGDAVYELRVREYLLSEGNTRVEDLHKKAIQYTMASNQAYIIKELLSELSEEEIEYFKKGRNAVASHKPKSSSLKEYHDASGFESLIGALFLEKREERLSQIIEKSIFLSNKKIANFSEKN